MVSMMMMMMFMMNLLLLAVQPCLANRGFTDYHHPSYSRIGRFNINGGGNLFGVSRRRNKNNKNSNNNKNQNIVVLRDEGDGLDYLSDSDTTKLNTDIGHSSSSRLFDDDYNDYNYKYNDESTMVVKEASVRTKKHKKKKKRKSKTSSPPSQQVVEEDDVDVEMDITTTTTTTTGATPKFTKEELSIRVSDPIISEEIWNELSGEEFENPTCVDRLARSGIEMAMMKVDDKKNPWIDWKTHKETTKLLSEKDEWSALQDGDVLMYVGKVKREDGYGSNLPIIRTKSILPLSAESMAELLMDSSRVKTYNKLSVGRTDVKIYNDSTKIVCNLTKPPIAKNKMVSITLMHSRKLNAEQDSEFLMDSQYKDGYIVVSRAVPGMIDDDLAELSRNDILLGVNVLQDIGPDQCMMTAVTHVYSPALPQMLAKKMGVSSAVNFVKDIRAACIPVI